MDHQRTRVNKVGETLLGQSIDDRPKRKQTFSMKAEAMLTASQSLTAGSTGGEMSHIIRQPFPAARPHRPRVIPSFRGTTAVMWT
jgi:hypothetical protein